MVGLEVEIVRATLVIGLTVSGLVYHFTRVSSGGVVTTPFLALLVMTGRWDEILGWAVIALLGVLAIRLVATRWPVPRSWLFYFGIFITTAIHVAGLELSGSETATRLEGLGLFLSAGLYVCSGLTAYDAVRQGIGRTFVATALVTAAIVAIIIPLRYVTTTFGGPQPMVVESPLRNPVLALICVGMAVAMRIGPYWGTAGIIGGLYLLNIASWQSILVVAAFALIGSWIYRSLADRLGISRKERLYVLLATGSLMSWFGLFWASWLGIPGAAEVSAYPIEPLIVIGLMIGETVRYGVARTVAGSAVVFAVTAAAAAILTANPDLTLVVLAAAMALVIAIIALSLIRVRHEWAVALKGGDRWGVQPQNLSAMLSPRTQIRALDAAPDSGKDSPRE